MEDMPVTRWRTTAELEAGELERQATSGWMTVVGRHSCKKEEEKAEGAAPRAPFLLRRDMPCLLASVPCILNSLLLPLCLFEKAGKQAVCVAGLCSSHLPSVPYVRQGRRGYMDFGREEGRWQQDLRGGQ